MKKAAFILFFMSIFFSACCYANTNDTLDISSISKPTETKLMYGNFDDYKDRMYSYNYRIQQIALDNNSYGQSYDLLYRARDLAYEVRDARYSYNRDYGNRFDNYAVNLRRLFELEAVRINAMVDGINAGLNGRDPMRYFSRGTAAAYEFDDVLRRFESGY